MLDKNLPPDPFGPDETPDLTQWGSNCRAMFMALVAAGFKEDQALEFTIRIMCSIMTKAVKLWAGAGNTTISGSGGWI